MTDNKLIWLIGAVLVIIFFLQKQETETFSLFPQYQDSGKIRPLSTAYTEGDTFGLDATPQAIFIDGKLYFRGNIGTRADECGSMNTPPVSIPNSPEVPIELTPGTHIVEGWATYVTGINLKCGREMQMAYFRFNINVAYAGGIQTNNTKIITLSMRNTGGQGLYDIELQNEGTTPMELYTAFANLKKFQLEPNGQAIFFANMDVSKFNGVIPFQMLFKAKYNLNNNVYTLTKFTDPLILKFNNGVLDGDIIQPQSSCNVDVDCFSVVEECSKCTLGNY